MHKATIDRCHRPRVVTSPSRRRCWARLALALMVMLGAVLPHVTLAATLHQNASAHSVMTLASEAAAPCHDDKPDATHRHTGLMAPACCALGCGLLASSLVATPSATAARWLRLLPSPDRAVSGLVPEPAERPPRAHS